LVIRYSTSDIIIIHSKTKKHHDRIYLETICTDRGNIV